MEGWPSKKIIVQNQNQIFLHFLQQEIETKIVINVAMYIVQEVPVKIGIMNHGDIFIIYSNNQKTMKY